VEPDIRYARNGDVAIAYQVVGDADRDLVLVPDFMSNLVYDWESAYLRDFYVRLSRSFRLILFDKRGTGLSDHGPEYASLEQQMEDMRTLLDAAGSKRAIVFGQYEGSATAALYAATYPERTHALVLFQGFNPKSQQGVCRDRPARRPAQHPRADAPSLSRRAHRARDGRCGRCDSERTRASVSASTRANAHSPQASRRGSRSRPVPASPRPPSPAKSSSRRR
jgi:pimeloyl-ACP methyl ester carboxylesterase